MEAAWAGRKRPTHVAAGAGGAQSCSSPPCHHRLLAAAYAEVSRAEVLCDHGLHQLQTEVELGRLRAFCDGGQLAMAVWLNW